MFSESVTITSRQNPTVQRAARLDQKKYRDAERLFLVHGLKLSLEAMQCGVEIEEIFVSLDALGRVRAFFEAAGISLSGRVFLLAEHVFEKISPEKSPDGIICVAKRLDNFHKSITIKKEESVAEAGERLLLLESLRDPGNLGTVLRSAAAFGVDRVMLSADCAELYNPRTLRAAMGAAFKLPTVRVDDISAAIAGLRESGRRVWAAALSDNAQRLDELALEAEDCFLIGNEGHGLSADSIAAADGEVFIPMRPHTESLNAAAAAAVCLWEQARRFGVD
ncbi:MAG: RNA methyltransferase [Clostridia bacterium]|nr:RNA methyltransferase [Clostridia bacterium]